MELENLEKYLVTAQALAPCYTPPASSMKIRVSELNKFIAALPAYQEGGEL